MRKLYDKRNKCKILMPKIAPNSIVYNMNPLFLLVLLRLSMDRVIVSTTSSSPNSFLRLSYILNSGWLLKKVDNVAFKPLLSCIESWWLVLMVYGCIFSEPIICSGWRWKPIREWFCYLPYHWFLFSGSGMAIISCQIRLTPTHMNLYLFRASVMPPFSSKCAMVLRFCT